MRIKGLPTKKENASQTAITPTDLPLLLPLPSLRPNLIMPSVAIILVLSLALGARSVLASPISLPSVVREESCSNTDTDCWNRNAPIFVNQYRATQGKGALVSSPGPML